MQDSTAQRERLASPLVLGLMAGLFVVAFLALRPATVPGIDSVGGDSPANPGQAPFDELSLAYLRAEQASGRDINEKLGQVIESLLRAGRIEEVRTLIEQFPRFSLNEELRFRLDMERSAQESNDNLYVTLQSLSDSPYLQNDELSRRALELSQRLGQPILSASIYSRWINAASTESSAMARNLECGHYFRGIGERELARNCFDSAQTLARDPRDLASIKLDKLLLIQKGSAQQEQLIKDLMQSQTLSGKELERYADILLQLSRPELAFRLYARLAILEPDRSNHWLQLAARWAEAANQPLEAAVFLDALTESTDITAVQRRGMQKKVETLLVWAGRTREAYAKLQSRWRASPNDQQILRQGVELARQLGETTQALEWNTRLLSLDPDALDTLRMQRTLALESGNLELAAKWAQRIVELHPGLLNDREVLARVSEWAGNADAALQHWLSVAEQSHVSPLLQGSTPPDSGGHADQNVTTKGPALAAANTVSDTTLMQSQHVAALTEVVRLAERTLQPGTGAEALRELAETRMLDDSDVIRLVTLYDLDGRSEVVSKVLQDIQSRYGAKRIIFRTLASHEKYHGNYEKSLLFWEQYTRQFGDTVEATLGRVEMLWRLNRVDEAAQAADYLKGKSLLSEADEFQVRLLAEIAWQFRKPWLSTLIQPRLKALDAVEERLRYGQRNLRDLQESGKYREALAEAMQLWTDTADNEFALVAMRLASRVGDANVLAQFAPLSTDAQVLRAEPGYWAQIAAQRLQSGNPQSATEAYQQALKIDSVHEESIAGLLWLAIGESNDAKLRSYLDTYTALADESPVLWPPMAVGYLQLGAASSSLPWFNKLLDQIETDYGMLLSYADALELAGRSGDALKVRRYTLQRLRPVLVNGTEKEQDLLLQQYSRLSARYADVESNEQLFNYLIETDSHRNLDGTITTSDALWRQDMAISWLMSTQQFEHAKVIMASIHARRLQEPNWQKMAIALADKDELALKSLLQAKGPLSLGNRIMALRQLGNESEAYSMARQLLLPGRQMMGADKDDLQLARSEYVALRDAYPSFVSGAYRMRSARDLKISESGVKIRHSFLPRGLGLSLELSNRRLDSDRFDIADSDQLTDATLALFIGNDRQGTRFSAGIQSGGGEERVHASATYARRLNNQRNELIAELAYNEEIELSPELVIGARQNRLSMAFDISVGRSNFMRLQADANEINTRVQQDRVASGFSGSLEYGLRGNFGSNSWSGSVQANYVKRDREAVLPDELRLSPESTMDGMLAEEVQNLSLGASLQRGGINADFPQTSSPRYFINASLGKSWPDNAVGFQLGLGAGVRVIGGDELSFSVSHDALAGTRSSSDFTAFGLNYRFHFQ